MVNNHFIEGPTAMYCTARCTLHTRRLMGLRVILHICLCLFFPYFPTVRAVCVTFTLTKTYDSFAMAAIWLAMFSLYISGLSKPGITWDGVADDKSAGPNNTRSLNAALSSLRPGQTLQIPNATFHMAGCVPFSSLVY